MTTAATIVRADWSRVTLGEYAALNVLTSPDPVGLLDAVWDEIHEHNPFRGDTPTRLTDDGRAWLDTLRATALDTPDEHELIRVTREFHTGIGSLVIGAAERRRKGMTR